MPRFFNNAARANNNTDLPEYWLDGHYSSKIIKSHITVLALAFAAGFAFFAGLSAVFNGAPLLGAVCFSGTLFILLYAYGIIDKLKTWQWLDRKRAHEFELDLVTLQNDHTTLKYQHGLLAGMVRRGAAEDGARDGSSSADIVDLNGRRH